VIDRSRIRPSLWWLVLAGPVAVAGIAAAVVVAVFALRDVTGPFVNLTGPTVVHLRAGEGRGIWARTSAELSGYCSATGPVRARMERTSGVTVTIDGRQYRSFLHFKAPRTSDYRIDCATSGPVALGPRVTGRRLVAGVIGGLACFFGGLMLAAAIVAAVLILRERSTRRLELEARGGPRQA
jgi:hypothetical protein